MMINELLVPRNCSILPHYFFFQYSFLLLQISPQDLLCSKGDGNLKKKAAFEANTRTHSRKDDEVSSLSSQGEKITSESNLCSR